MKTPANSEEFQDCILKLLPKMLYTGYAISNFRIISELCCCYQILRGEIIMKKIFRQLLTLSLVVILTCALCAPVSAASKNVTSTYKKKVSAMLDPFDTYLGYSSIGTFKYDSYTKTSMLIHSSVAGSMYGKSFKYAKPKLKSKMKLYFGTTGVSIHKYNSSKKWISNASYLWVLKNGRITYTGGDWGTVYPVGRVYRVYQTSSKRFEVIYKIRLYDAEKQKYTGNLGTFRFYLKKASNTNGFVITNIKRTAKYHGML